MNESNDKIEPQDEFESVENDSFEDSDLEDLEENSIEQIKKLKKQLRASEAEKMEHMENLQRAKAEFLNGKRRLEDERIRDKDRAVTQQIEKLIPLCDSFVMALSDTERLATINNQTWVKGIEGIYIQLQSILASYKVSLTNPVGEEFNPTLHDALTTVPVTDKTQNHKIISVIQNGYVRQMGEMTELIRPARVTVGEYTA